MRSQRGAGGGGGGGVRWPSPCWGRGSGCPAGLPRLDTRFPPLFSHSYPPRHPPDGAAAPRPRGGAVFAVRGPPSSAHLRARGFSPLRAAFPFLCCFNLVLILFVFRQVERLAAPGRGAGRADRVCAPAAPPDRRGRPRK